MIDITIDREGYEITAAGHAGYSAAGSDIICSAVSTLLHTLASYITLHGELLCGEPTVECEDGYMVVSFMPKDEARTELDAVFGVICHGLRALGEQYGAYVRVSEEDEECLSCQS